MSQSNIYNNVYCFKIILQNGDKLHLSSYDKIITIDDISYYPYSGLHINTAFFSDSLKDHIILEGLFEPLGIQKNTEIVGANVQIYLHSGEPLVSYYITKITNLDYKFNLLLEPEAIKYQQNIVKYYSETCRANLGDSHCQVILSNYTVQVKIINMEGRIITVEALNYPNSYFDCGSVYTLDKIFVGKILKQSMNSLELSIFTKNYLSVDKIILLIAGCNKKFLTCCNKFNNAVNFRGEPFIPQSRFINHSN